MQTLLCHGQALAASCTLQRRVSCSTSRKCILLQRNFRSGAALRQHVSNGTKCTAFFKLGGTTSEAGGVYGSQKREDYTADDVEHYFNYMGMLAEKGTYDDMDKVIAAGIHPADILLQWAAQENDTPKAAELLRAGANPSVKDLDGKTPSELTTDEEIKAMLLDPEKARTFEEN